MTKFIVTALTINPMLLSFVVGVLLALATCILAFPIQLLLNVIF
jgi:hypothetical protein